VTGENFNEVYCTDAGYHITNSTAQYNIGTDWVTMTTMLFGHPHEWFYRRCGWGGPRFPDKAAWEKATASKTLPWHGCNTTDDNSHATVTISNLCICSHEIRQNGLLPIATTPKRDPHSMCHLQHCRYLLEKIIKKSKKKSSKICFLL